jgi:hypothetical protein
MSDNNAMHTEPRSRAVSKWTITRRGPVIAGVIWYGIAAESDPLGMISGYRPYPPLAIHPHGYQSAEQFRRNDTSH